MIEESTIHYSLIMNDNIIEFPLTSKMVDALIFNRAFIAFEESVAEWQRTMDYADMNMEYLQDNEESNSRQST